MENSTVETNNKHSTRKEHYHDLSRATRAKNNKKNIAISTIFFLSEKQLHKISFS